MASAIPERDTRNRPGEPLRHLRHEDVATLAERHHARARIHGGAERRGVVAEDLADVDADADAERRFGRLALPSCERFLDLHPGSDRRACGGEREHHRVTDGVDLTAASRLAALPDETLRLRQHLARGGVADARRQSRRPLDVGMHDGDDAARLHVLIVAGRPRTNHPHVVCAARAR
jgi:hypothetical protein